MWPKGRGGAARTISNSDVETHAKHTPGSDMDPEERIRQLNDQCRVKIEQICVQNFEALLIRLKESTAPESEAFKALTECITHSRSQTRSLRQLQELIGTTCSELNRDWMTTKMEVQLAMQNAEISGVNFTDLNTMVTNPYQIRQAETAFATEELAGMEVSEDRRSRLNPKPKAKGRGKKMPPAPVIAPAAVLPGPPEQLNVV